MMKFCPIISLHMSTSYKTYKTKRLNININYNCKGDVYIQHKTKTIEMLALF